MVLLAFGGRDDKLTETQLVQDYPPSKWHSGCEPRSFSLYSLDALYFGDLLVNLPPQLFASEGWEMDPRS